MTSVAGEEWVRHHSSSAAWGVAGFGVVGEIPLPDPAPLGVVGDPDRPGAAAVAGEFNDAPGAVGSLHVRGLPSKQMF